MPKSTDGDAVGLRPRAEPARHLAAEAVVAEEDVADAGHQCARS